MINKRSLKSGVKVTFYTEPYPEHDAVYIVGDFNNWNENASPMVQLKDGRFKLSILLEKGMVYQFRYLVDGWKYENESQADQYFPNPFSGDNSAIVT